LQAVAHDLVAIMLCTFVAIWQYMIWPVGRGLLAARRGELSLRKVVPPAGARRAPNLI
jgi:hypothetical protein